jgi:hypothetical protein
VAAAVVVSVAPHICVSQGKEMQAQAVKARLMVAAALVAEGKQDYAKATEEEEVVFLA